MALTDEEREAAAQCAENYPKGHGRSYFSNCHMPYAVDAVLQVRENKKFG